MSLLMCVMYTAKSLILLASCVLRKVSKAGAQVIDFKQNRLRNVCAYIPKGIYTGFPMVGRTPVYPHTCSPETLLMTLACAEGECRLFWRLRMKGRVFDE